jgi:cytoskeletal protein CcmA (bactofilin family)
MAEQAKALDTSIKAPASLSMPLGFPNLYSTSGSGPARVSEAAPQSAEGAVGRSGSEIDRGTLLVGQGISFSGEVSSCDRLIVEGTIQAKLQKCQHIIIAETGIFNGEASTENADVRGRFEGELVVRKRLLIRAGGQVSGKISYREIEIEAGGKISGGIEELGAPDLTLPLLSARA